MTPSLEEGTKIEFMTYQDFCTCGGPWISWYKWDIFMRIYETISLYI